MAGRRRHTSRDRRVQLSVAVLLLGASGCGAGVSAGGSTEPKPPSPENSMTVDRPPSTVPAALECGQAITATPAGPLTLAGRFPATVGSTEQTVAGTVEVTSGNAVVRGVSTPGADVFLVRDGRVVTLPLPQDSMGRTLQLGPADVEKLPALAALAPCDSAGDTAGGSLGPGTYQLYARVLVNLDDGSTLESVGGPWPLEIR